PIDGPYHTHHGSDGHHLFVSGHSVRGGTRLETPTGSSATKLVPSYAGFVEFPRCSLPWKRCLSVGKGMASRFERVWDKGGSNERNGPAISNLAVVVCGS